MTSRFEEMRNLLNNSEYFKLVCGAGNENGEEVKRLALVYTLAGCNGFDVSATPNIVEACVSGITQAYELSANFGIKIPIRPFITVSVGMPGDHHVRKAIIKSGPCIECNLCNYVCPSKIPISKFIKKGKAGLLEEGFELPTPAAKLKGLENCKNVK